MSKVIVALDNMDINPALKLAQKLKGKVWGFKVNDLLINTGKLIVEMLKNHGRVFADPKFYDIPNTVGNGVSRLAEAGSDLITVHASGGISMMKQAVSAARSSNSETKILAVTLLTSLPNNEAWQVYGLDHLHLDTKGVSDDEGRTNLVLNLVDLAIEAGVDGIVCSPKEATAVREKLGNKLIVLPAFRPPGTENNDQIHTGGYEEAKFADYIVVGRPITQSNDPVAAAEAINAGVRKAETVLKL